MLIMRYVNQQGLLYMIFKHYTKEDNLLFFILTY